MLDTNDEPQNVAFDTITVRRLNLVNEAGERRCTMSIDEHDMPKIQLYSGGNPTPRMVLEIKDDEGPSVCLLDRNGSVRASFHLYEDDDAGIALYNEKDKEASISLTALNGSQAHIWMRDPVGKSYCRVFAGDPEDGAGFVIHAAGHVRTVLKVDDTGSNLFMNGNSPSGEDVTRIVIDARESNASSVTVQDIMGRTVGELSSPEDSAV